MREVILALDAGGTSIKAGILRGEEIIAERSFAFLSEEREQMLSVFRQALAWGRDYGPVCLGVACPGPFDFAKGVSHMRHKWRGLMDVPLKYAERQLRERAKTIAQTERAFAYEYGRYQHTKNLVDQGILPPQDKKWSATDSENTCSTCRELNGKVVGMDEEFAPGKLLPPLHPRCKCCVMYVNSKSMAAEYETEEDELREYSTEEIETHANKMSEIADKHLDLESSWSGKVVVDDDSGVYGIQWNGDIITRHETAPHILLHEQLHARSVTKYDHKMYKQYENMEEGSVQFAAQEISKKENIQILESQYDHMTEALRNINKVAGLFKNDYDFAMKLISVPLPDRYDWLNNMIYDKMMLSGNIEDYQKVSHWMEALENGKTS